MKQIPFIKAVLPANSECPSSTTESFKSDFTIGSDERLECARCYLCACATASPASAIDFFQNLDKKICSEDLLFDHFTVASIYQAGVWLYVNAANYTTAINYVIKAMARLACCDEKEKKSLKTKTLVAALLYDYALACHAVNSNTKAEKALTKSAALYNRLIRKDYDRFFEPSAIVAAASTEIYKSRVKQLNALAHHYAATEYYMGAMKAGMANAVNGLIASITKEAETMLAIGRYRTAVRYFTKAIRYQRQSSGRFDLRELRLSLKLAEALLYIPMRHDTAVKLLASLRKAAESMDAKRELEKINDLEEKERLLRFNIFSVIKNLI